MPMIFKGIDQISSLWMCNDCRLPHFLVSTQPGFCPQWPGDGSHLTLILEGMENPLAEQRKPCPAIHSSLQQFELVDLTFYLAIGIDQR